MSAVHFPGAEWRKSTRSGGGNDANCVEVNIWRKSSQSGNGNDSDCVEVAIPFDGSLTGVRDSKDSTGPVLAFAAADWRSFTAAARSGAFDRR